MTYEKICEDCHLKFDARSKLTKRCDFCRLLKDFLFIHTRNATKRKCVLCSSIFCPIKFGEDLCAACNTRMTAKRDPVTCVCCNETRQPLAGSEIPVCWFCGHESKYRITTMQWLKTGVARRMASSSTISA